MDLEEKTQRSTLQNCLLDMGALLLDCGAEISRVEDTIRRLGRAYGAERLDVFVIPSIISLSVSFPDGEVLTETRRIRSMGSTDFYRLEKLNALSRSCCAEPLPLEDLQKRLDKIGSGKKPVWAVYVGNFIGAFGFAVFFGGSVWDGITAALFSLMISFLQRRLGRTELNPVAGNLILSLLTGLGVGAVTLLLPQLDADKILIGDIMLLIPGLAMTNAVRNMLVGDTISGVVRLAETLIWAGALAGGFMVSMLALNYLR